MKPKPNKNMINYSFFKNEPIALTLFKSTPKVENTSFRSITFSKKDNKIKPLYPSYIQLERPETDLKKRLLRLKTKITEIRGINLKHMKIDFKVIQNDNSEFSVIPLEEVYKNQKIIKSAKNCNFNQTNNSSSNYFNLNDTKYLSTVESNISKATNKKLILQNKVLQGKVIKPKVVTKLTIGRNSNRNFKLDEFNLSQESKYLFDTINSNVNNTLLQAEIEKKKSKPVEEKPKKKLSIFAKYISNLAKINNFGQNEDFDLIFSKSNKNLITVNKNITKSKFSKYNTQTFDPASQLATDEELIKVLDEQADNSDDNILGFYAHKEEEQKTQTKTHQNIIKDLFKLKSQDNDNGPQTNDLFNNFINVPLHIRADTKLPHTFIKELKKEREKVREKTFKKIDNITSHQTVINNNHFNKTNYGQLFNNRINELSKFKLEPKSEEDLNSEYAIEFRKIMLKIEKQMISIKNILIFIEHLKNQIFNPDDILRIFKEKKEIEIEILKKKYLVKKSLNPGVVSRYKNKSFGKYKILENVTYKSY